MAAILESLAADGERRRRLPRSQRCGMVGIWFARVARGGRIHQQADVLTLELSDIRSGTRRELVAAHWGSTYTYQPYHILVLARFMCFM